MSMVPPSDEDVVGSEGSVHQINTMAEELAPAKVDDEPGLPVDEQIKRLEQQLDSLLKKKDEPRVRTVEETKAFCTLLDTIYRDLAVRGSAAG